MILLDTNVVSQMIRPSRTVIAWLRTHAAETYLPVLAISEMAYGIELSDDRDQRMTLTNAIAAVRLLFEDRIVPFDAAAAEAHGWLQGRAKRAGGRLPEIDSQIAAIAISRNAKIATRNIADFERTGVKLINPWTA